MENSPYYLAFACCFVIVFVASVGAFLTGIGMLVSRKRANRDNAEGSEQQLLKLPAALIVVGGLITLLYVAVYWKDTYDRKQSEPVACRTIILTENYKLEFIEQRDGTHYTELQELDVEADSLKWPAEDITQLAIIDDYVGGEERSGYWFVVDLRELRSGRHFSTQEEFAEALSDMGLSGTPELVTAEDYCDVETCQICPYPAFTQ